MLLAAGDGTRMRPLTENLPKPLLEAGGKPLLQYHIEALRRAGVREIVINHARLGRMIERRFGDGESFGVRLRYSAEGEAPLETGGGIQRALALLGEDGFLAINADIWTDYPFQRLLQAAPPRLVLVPNPPHHPQGDFALQGERVRLAGGPRYTFSGIGLYTPAMFADLKPGKSPLAPLLRRQIAADQITGERYDGPWFDIGTPQRLRELEVFLGESANLN